MREELHQKLREQAAVEGRPMAELIRELVASYLKKKEGKS